MAALSIGSGLSSGGLLPGTAFTITKVGIKFKFGSSSDSLSVQGLLPVASDFTPASKGVVLEIGGLKRTITLNAKVVSSDKNNGIKIPIKGKAGKLRKVTISLKKQALFAELESLGYRNADVPKPGDDVPLPVILTIGADVFSVETSISERTAGSLPSSDADANRLSIPIIVPRISCKCFNFDLLLSSTFMSPLLRSASLAGDMVDALTG